MNLHLSPEGECVTEGTARSLPPKWPPEKPGPGAPRLAPRLASLTAKVLRPHDPEKGSGENRRGSPGAARASRGRSFSHPRSRRGTGNSGQAAGRREVTSSSLPEGEFQEKAEQGVKRALTIELPPRDVGEDRIRTDNHARKKRSNPDLTAWKMIGSHAENRAPMSSLRGWRTTLVRRGRRKNKMGRRDGISPCTGLRPRVSETRG